MFDQFSGTISNSINCWRGIPVTLTLPPKCTLMGSMCWGMTGFMTLVLTHPEAPGFGFEWKTRPLH